jgi:hypothetical protein
MCFNSGAIMYDDNCLRCEVRYSRKWMTNFHILVASMNFKRSHIISIQRYELNAQRIKINRLPKRSDYRECGGISRRIREGSHVPCFADAFFRQQETVATASPLPPSRAARKTGLNVDLIVLFYDLLNASSCKSTGTLESRLAHWERCGGKLSYCPSTVRRLRTPGLQAEMLSRDHSNTAPTRSSVRGSQEWTA